MKKNQYLSVSFTTVYILMLIISMVCASYEFNIRDQYRFLEKMPLPFLTSITCNIVIAFAGLFNVVDFYKVKRVRKINLILFLLTIGFVSLTATKNFRYYSGEISILKQGFVKSISENDIIDLVEKDVSAMLYIDGGEAEESRQVNSLLRRYAYYGQHTVYVFYEGYKLQELSKSSDTKLVGLHAESLPALFFIENGKIAQILYYDEILEQYASWAEYND